MFDISKAKELNNTIIECTYSNEDGACFYLIIHDNTIFTTNSSGREKYISDVSDITQNKEWMFTMKGSSDITMWYKDFVMRILFYINKNNTYLSSFLNTLSIEYKGLKFRLGFVNEDGNVTKWVGKSSKVVKFDDWC